LESLHLKKAIFHSDKVVIFRKKGDVTIHTEDIISIEYTKPTLLKYFLAGLAPGGSKTPGWLYILVKNNEKKHDIYLLKIDHKDIVKLPDFYQKKLDPYYDPRKPDEKL